jgi:hypothetical protein
VAATLQNDPSILFPALYRNKRWYQVNFSLGTPRFFIHKRISPAGADGNHVELCGWLDLSDKAAATGLPNLPAVAAESNAEEWCSAVDIGGKEGFIKISSGLPAS